MFVLLFHQITPAIVQCRVPRRPAIPLSFPSLDHRRLDHAPVLGLSLSPNHHLENFIFSVFVYDSVLRSFNDKVCDCRQPNSSPDPVKRTCPLAPPSHLLYHHPSTAKSQPPAIAMASYSDLPTSPQTPGSMSSRRVTNRNTNRYSVTALFSMAAEQDVEVEDELGRGMWIVFVLLEI